MSLENAIKLALGTLEDVRGNINPERGFCEELEADVQRAIDALAKSTKNRNCFLWPRICRAYAVGQSELLHTGDKMKITIYYGNQKPIQCTGVNQVKLMEFAYRNRGWHTYKNDKATRTALRALAAKKYIEVLGDQFRFIGAHA